MKPEYKLFSSLLDYVGPYLPRRGHRLHATSFACTCACIYNEQQACARRVGHFTCGFADFAIKVLVGLVKFLL